MSKRLALVSLVVIALFVSLVRAAHAHEFKLDASMNAFVRIDGHEAHLVLRAPLYLFKAIRFPSRGTEIDVEKAQPLLPSAVEAITRDVTLYENGKPLFARGGNARLTLPSDRSFETYERARASIAEPPDPSVAIVVDQGYVDAHIVYPIASQDSVFSVRTTAAPELGDYLKLTVRYEPPNGAARAVVLTSRSGTVDLNPSWIGAATGFVGLGIFHILQGYDHVLFLLCLVIPLRSVRQILLVVTGFTVAHSFTLIGSAFNLAPSGGWFPPFVETVIALSIVYMALEDIIGVELRRRLLLTLLFGLIHGFGFSYGLREDLQFAGTHLTVALLAFNLGIEIGQLMVLAVMLPLLRLTTRFVLPGRIGEIVLAALVAHIGWHWLGERFDALSKAPWPTLDTGGVALLLMWLAVLCILGGLAAMVVSKLRIEPIVAPLPSAAGRGTAD